MYKFPMNFEMLRVGRFAENQFSVLQNMMWALDVGRAKGNLKMLVTEINICST